jgi:hypothetical protein
VTSSIKRRAARLQSPRIEVPEAWVPQVSELGHKFEYRFNPIHWFDARQGYKRFPGGAANSLGEPVGYAYLWRERSGDVVARMTSQGHRIAFKVLSASGAPVLDEEIEDVNFDLLNLLELWIFQGADDWPEI